MDPHVAPHWRMIEDLRRQVLEAVAPLDDAALNRQVPPLANTIGVLLRHMAGSERYWVTEVAGGRPVNRNRDAEFAAPPARKADLVAELERVREETRAVLERLTAADLLEEVEARRVRGVTRETRAGALLHVTQHLAYHLGQIRYLTRLMASG
ncbi:MAG: DinB family protein [Armatimonadota bacterium]|nr:DinB family protein [Armatimonadota bacterium]MDR7420992.1 DinB family protein [Armatimonadota bacterium]MDR7457714.1 DinB family protein [Armatimonadota bacterium]MDR7497443.1 DinB family protein [Armatimonadota bacterium]